MLDHVRDVPGRRLSLPEYRADFQQSKDTFHPNLDKLERKQAFRDTLFPSWCAFERGDCQEALRLMEADRSNIRAMYAEYRRLGMIGRRVRVVDQPVTPYLWWELRYLKMRGECGEQIQVISSDLLSPFEVERPVPELVVMAPHVMYEVLYSPDGLLEGGRRIDDTDVINACQADIQSLFEQGENLQSYFDREVAGLPAPVGHAV